MEYMLTCMTYNIMIFNLFDFKKILFCSSIFFFFFFVPKKNSLNFCMLKS